MLSVDPIFAGVMVFATLWNDIAVLFNDWGNAALGSGTLGTIIATACFNISIKCSHQAQQTIAFAGDVRNIAQAIYDLYTGESLWEILQDHFPAIAGIVGDIESWIGSIIYRIWQPLYSAIFDSDNDWNYSWIGWVTEFTNFIHNPALSVERWLAGYIWVWEYMFERPNQWLEWLITNYIPWLAVFYPDPAQGIITIVSDVIVDILQAARNDLYWFFEHLLLYFLDGVW